VLLSLALPWGLLGSTARAQGSDDTGRQQPCPPAQSTQQTIATASLAGMVLAADTGRRARNVPTP